MIVLDSSAAVHYLVGGSAAQWVTDHVLADPDLHTPSLMDVEVANALRRLTAGGLLSAARARRGLDDLLLLDATRYPHRPLLPRAWALRNNLSAYDAVYVALAEALDAILLTTDARIARAPGIRATVRAFE